MKIKAKIITRSEPCRCGCKGQDPWHARSFQRTIQVTSTSQEESRKSADGAYTWMVLTRGTARFPWGRSTVVEKGIKDNSTGKVHRLGWYREEG